jgi:hypothetical protein
MRRTAGIVLVVLCGLSLAAQSNQSSETSAGELMFEGSYPTPATVTSAYDDVDLGRAVQAYRFFFPTVSGIAIYKGFEKVGCVPNEVFGTLDTQPRHVGLTFNSDTPYGSILIDLKDGPVVMEVPAGPLIVAAFDVNQRWVADMGLPGPDAGHGGKHVLVPPGYKGKVPDGYYAATSSSNRVIVGARALPQQGDVKGANDLLKTIKVYPLDGKGSQASSKWIDLTARALDSTPLDWEKNLQYWQELHDVIDTEPAYKGYRNAYGDLAGLGIVKGQPFAPDDRMKAILEKAALLGNAQMRVQSFADRRPDRVVWPDRKWEWAALRFENGDFDAATYTDLEARDKWFFQAIVASPAMFRRSAGAGSVYWLGTRDGAGAYLDGGKTYKLTVPQPVPGKLFWSVTVYDAETRSQIQTDQGHAALRSMFELKGKTGGSPVDLYFGPSAPAGQEAQWIKTIPGKGWFVYMRIYGPEDAAFDGSWKPGDFEQVKP